MAGLLDKKTRIFDTVLTDEGRRQLSTGKLRFSFASFTDGGTFYEADIVSGSSDASERVFLEAPSALPGDQITFETDDAGHLLSFYGAGDHLFLMGDKIGVSGSTTAVSGDAFSSLAGELLSSSISNFKNLELIGTRDIFADDEGFTVNRQIVDYTVTKLFPFDVDHDIVSMNIDNAPNFFKDGRLAQAANFKYLPPVNVGSTASIGNFSPKGEDALSYEQIMSRLSAREKAEITFPVTSQENNIFSQLFEVGNGSMKKLDIIDYGEFTTADPARSHKQIFFAGKVLIDSTGNGTYVNQFTIILD